MKHIPNALSISRIPLSIAMLFLTKRPAAFLVVYAAAGLTDVLDGFLARRFHWESEFGAKIDGFADIGFMLAMLGVVFGLMRHVLNFKAYLVIGVAVVAALKVVNLCFTKCKFKEWSTMHTLANKYTALPFYFIVPYCVWFQKVPNGLIMVFLATVFIANLEETWILASADTYDADMKGMLHLKKRLRTAEQEEAENKEDAIV
ncbi:MAG: CDP-alcohol phosphatidyltransferase family protein [Oscillospiraceae bacterium]|nr:CDP-alcohol phosphatidyltransferase family protein [Oscillospiraceae bacterium]